MSVVISPKVTMDMVHRGRVGKGVLPMIDYLSSKNMHVYGVFWTGFWVADI